MAVPTKALAEDVKYTLSLGADVNGDGVIQLHAHDFIPQDRSAIDQPFVFWINDDQDDLELYESWPHQHPDNEDELPGSLRDLEDFSRIHIELGSENTQLSATSLRLYASGEAQIRLWLSEGNDCSRNYLIDDAHAKKQFKFMQKGALGVVDAKHSVNIDALDSKLDKHGRICLVFEAVKSGRLTLRAELLQQERLVSSNELYLDLYPVKSLYERVQVVWPKQLKHPYKYKLLPPEVNLTLQPETLGFDFHKPWYEDNNVLIWVHGWIPHDEENYQRTLVFSFETMFKRLWHQGYRGRLVHFHWPTRKRANALGLLSSEFRGLKSAALLLDYVNALPDSKNVKLTCHSLGGIVLMEALHQGLEADEVIFQVSAVPAEAFDTRDELLVTELNKTVTPRDASDGGWSGYIGKSNAEIYSLFNPEDVTWLGWNAAQVSMKPLKNFGRKYSYDVHRNSGDQARLRYWWWFSRPVDDEHEALAYIINSKTQALGAEARVEGDVLEAYNLALPPYEYGADHVAMWRWNPQDVMPYFSLMLDIFNLRYNALEVLE
ncbi:alpha/beta hydrolase [Agaribacterium haliotis]|uniref:alpha/beta hydrolase n=1 Tax=Agaribacterium haliotis TaxID=2013869 RepID=UPI001304570D|nr:alpha/beta hydrolase [Agaribacterium haliotis]